MKRTTVLAACLMLAACASVQIDPQQHVATTLAPFNAQIGFNRVSVPSGSPLVAASVDGKPAFCTVRAAWFAIGEARSVCFTDEANDGHLTRYYVLGTLRSLTYEANIPYSLMTKSDVAQLKQQLTDEQQQAIQREANCHQQQAMIAALKPGFSPAQVADSAVAQAVFYEKCIRGF
jgi:hypothetical protein